MHIIYQQMLNVRVDKIPKVSSSIWSGLTAGIHPITFSFLDSTGTLSLISLLKKKAVKGVKTHLRFFFSLLLCTQVDLIFIGSPGKENTDECWHRNIILHSLPLIGWSLSHWVFLVIYSYDPSLTHIDFWRVKWLTFERGSLCIPSIFENVLNFLIKKENNRYSVLTIMHK